MGVSGTTIANLIGGLPDVGSAQFHTVERRHPKTERCLDRVFD